MADSGSPCRQVLLIYAQDLLSKDPEIHQLFTYRLERGPLLISSGEQHCYLIGYPTGVRNKGIWARLWKISYRGLLKIVTGSILMVYVVFCLDVMILMDTKNALRFLYPKEWQHLTMFILLTLSGCVDVMSKNLLPQRCVLLEKGTLALTFYVLLLLLMSHVQDSTGIELQTHRLLILVVFLLMLVLTIELWTPDTFHLLLIETFLFLMMGSWLIQAGFILYKPVTGYPWQDDDISDIMFITTFFCWHETALVCSTPLSSLSSGFKQHLAKWQHLTMFILLTLNGCVDVMSKNLLPQRCVLLEKGTLALTFYVLLLLLMSHVQDSTGIELQTHCLLILVVFLLMLVLTIELWTPDTFHLLLIETFLFLMMGSWLIQAGFILYKPVTGYPWQDDDISDIMFITTFFCWHMRKPGPKESLRDVSRE
ncbi:hypothetical protein GH733_010773 [Mirounga leonina]|nr:hypothetical protein GH733_010773 [Mirounga leonina]